jgi:hypothetical protein
MLLACISDAQKRIAVALTKKYSVKDYIDRYNQVKIYEKLEIYGMVGIIIYFIIKHRKDIILGKINLDSMEVYIAIFFIGIFFVIIEKAIEPLKKDLEKIKVTIRNEMIVKVCKCQGYYECKSDFNNYMKRNGVNILK